MSEVNIPGVNNKYHSKELVEKLMKVERIPLNNEEKLLKNYKLEQDAWRGLSELSLSLQDTLKNLYSFDNPFSAKNVSSTDENAVSAVASKLADYDDFTIKVNEIAKSDVFVSSDIESDRVEAGKYTFKVSDKEFPLKWKGGTIKAFLDFANKRTKDYIKFSLLSTNSTNRVLVVEGLKTGKDNSLVFKDDAVALMKSMGILDSSAEQNTVRNESIISSASDAELEYKGIKFFRSKNEIDDIVKGLHIILYKPTENEVTISLKSDLKQQKDALITFVGKYNQLIARLNILYQNNPELINELDYLSDGEKEELRKILGLLQGDSSILAMKNQLTSIIMQPSFSSGEIKLLSDIGIASNATSYSGLSKGRMRGYLEINEKKLDEALQNRLDNIRLFFGSDSDGDMVTDSGLGYSLDKQLSTYVRTGGIFSIKSSGVASKITLSERKITSLEKALSKKKIELEKKYARMEATLNSFETQQNAINNFSKRQGGQ